ncbi:SOS response-associated peptidase family protein [Rheinheimera fenheensis]|uniref:SOS response-associated peptidase family protein n=1 Tax=Rheinheimera fenheensis TaxID=3152295 RepID=UPI00326166FD
MRQTNSVITLAPHPKLMHIHSTAMPLILPQDSKLITAWLDEQNSNTEMFADLLQPHLPQKLIAQQIDKPSSYRAVAPAFEIAQD